MEEHLAAFSVLDLESPESPFPAPYRPHVAHGLPAGQKSTKLPKGKNKPHMAHSHLPPRTGVFTLPEPVPEWYEEDGLRKVKPYMYAFHSWAKERWHNRTLIDVYGEFRDRSPEFYEWAIESGTIVVNNAPSTASTILKNGDLISNVAHRHEPPVVAGPVRILYDGRLPGNDGQTLVVEKPGSMPVHSTGRYHFNTLLSILKYDYDLPLVHTSNRLDRLTSGVMICALTVEKSKELGGWFGGHRAADGGVNKEYVARCLGEFPEEETICEEPLLTIDRQLGVNVVHPDGRDSKTIFKRLSYDPRSNTSVVHCRPITGRSHQIRVHLQFLGFPIANDPVYQNNTAWGSSGGKGGVYTRPKISPEMKEVRRRMGESLMKQSLAGSTTSALDTGAGGDKVEASLYNKRGGIKIGLLSAEDAELLEKGAELEGRMLHDAPLSEEAKVAVQALRIAKDASDGWARVRDVEGIKRARDAAAGKERENVEGEEKDEMEFCETCFVPTLKDPVKAQMFIWLHALRYSTIEWDFKSEMPDWAREDWEGEVP